MSFTRRKAIIGVLGVAVAGGLVFEASNVFAKKDDSKPAAVTALTSSPGPAADATPSTAPSTTATSGPTSPTTTTASDPSGTGPGVFASDGVTPLSDFPSLQQIAGKLNGTTHLKTTIDAKVQAAAATALGTQTNAAMVVIQPSTGHILAVARRGTTDPLLATLPPGSTFKVITTEDLLRNGVAVNAAAPCTEIDTKFNRFHNDEVSLTNQAATLDWAFIQSCNTSFVGLMGQATSLNQEATKYFGLNQPWDLGVGRATYGASATTNVPTATGGDFAQEMFGQGQITMSPLTMASVAATVADGRFRQPVLIPGLKPAATATPLDQGIDAKLKSLMNKVVTQGTAKSLRNIPNVGAKTGTAETGPGQPNDSWMIAFQGDVAVACVVEGGGHGDQAAGPAIASLLKAIR